MLLLFASDLEADWLVIIISHDALSYGWLELFDCSRGKRIGALSGCERIASRCRCKGVSTTCAAGWRCLDGRCLELWLPRECRELVLLRGLTKTSLREASELLGWELTSKAWLLLELLLLLLLLATEAWEVLRVVHKLALTLEHVVVLL